MRVGRESANKGWGDALKELDELRLKLDSKEKELKEVKGEAAGLTKHYQSVVKELEDAKLSKKRTEEQLGAKKLEVLAVIVCARAKPCESICTDRI